MITTETLCWASRWIDDAARFDEEFAASRTSYPAVMEAADQRAAELRELAMELRKQGACPRQIGGGANLKSNPRAN